MVNSKSPNVALRQLARLWGVILNGSEPAPDKQTQADILAVAFHIAKQDEIIRAQELKIAELTQQQNWGSRNFGNH